MRKGKVLATAAAVAFATALTGSAAAPASQYDVLIAHGTIYDGSGSKPYVGDVAIKGDRIVYVGPHANGTAKRIIEAKGKAVAPGFINMLSWANESLLVDGRGQSDLRQGVTLEVMGEGDSMGPFTSEMKRLAESEKPILNTRSTGPRSANISRSWRSRA